MFENLSKNNPTMEKKENNNTEDVKKEPLNRPSSQNNFSVPELKKDSLEQKVDDMFADVDNQGAGEAGKNDGKKFESNNEKGDGGAKIIKMLVVIIIILILGVVGFVIANRFVGFVVFDGLDFLNKPQEYSYEEVNMNINNQLNEENNEIDNTEEENNETMEQNEEEMVNENSTTTEEEIIEENATTTEEMMEDENTANEIGDGDSDEDGLTDKEEYMLGTDMYNKDTDGDGLFDGDEYLNYKTNAKDQDTDKDGLPDAEEVLKYKTNPLNPDTDGDSYSDGVEVKNGYDPLS